MPLKVLDEKYISYSEAEYILSQYISESQQVSSILQRTQEYLKSVKKLEFEESQKLREDLEGLGLKRETSAIIASIMPDSLDELRSCLMTEEAQPPMDKLNQILDLVKKYGQR